MSIYGKDWKKVSEFVGSKNYMQCVSHYHFINNKKAEKKQYFKKILSVSEENTQKSICMTMHKENYDSHQVLERIEVLEVQN